MCDLPVQVRDLDRVAVHEADGADTRAGEVRSGRAAETTRSDEEDAGCLEA